jgi:hypothetical protein
MSRSEVQHTLNFSCRAKNGHIISEKERIDNGRGVGDADGSGGSYGAEDLGEGVDVYRIKVWTEDRALQDTRRWRRRRGSVIGQKNRGSDLVKQVLQQ